MSPKFEGQSSVRNVTFTGIASVSCFALHSNDTLSAEQVDGQPPQFTENAYCTTKLLMQPAIIRAERVEKYYAQPSENRIQVISPTALSITAGVIVALLWPCGSAEA